MDEKLNTLYDLCEVISRELEDVNQKIRSAGGGMSAGVLELVDKLTHALKSIKTTIAMMESEGYSNRAYPMAYRGRSYRGRSYESDGYGGMSNARGRVNNPMGRNQYSRDGYSYAESMDELLEDMRGMMHTLPEDKRRTAERLVDELSR